VKKTLWKFRFARYMWLRSCLSFYDCYSMAKAVLENEPEEAFEIGPYESVDEEMSCWGE